MVNRTAWLGALLISAAGVHAEESALLRPGAYAVEVRLDLPHLAETSARKTARLCLAGPPARGFPVLSDNAPLAGCPVAGVHREGEALGYAIVCEGRNQGQASAVYRLAPEGFEGRIAMRLGGKNMTMTEVQTGRRTGDCAPGESALP
jgi:hypothetical protein